MDIVLIFHLISLVGVAPLGLGTLGRYPYWTGVPGLCQPHHLPVLATIAAKGGGFIAQVKPRSDVEMMAITAANRDWMPGELVQGIRSQ